MITLHGVLTRYIYRNGSYHVAIVRSATGGDELTAFGDLAGLEEKEEVILHGDWTLHPRYGRRLKVVYWERPVPTTEEQVYAFLCSGLVRGVGPKTAKRILEKLGPEAIERILKEGPEVLKGIRGLRKLQQVYENICQMYSYHLTMRELLPLGLSPEVAARAHKEFGSSAAEVVKRNPYSLLRVGLGFSEADRIAGGLGIPPDSPERLTAALEHVLKESTQQGGHCFIPAGELIKRTVLLVSGRGKVGREAVVAAAKRLAHEGRIVVESGAVYPAALHAAERKVAEKVRILLDSGNDFSPEARVSRLIERWESQGSIRLSRGQKEAVLKLFNSGFLVLTGGPGTGKTTCVRAVVDVFRILKPQSIVRLAAPTGRAARRLSEVTGMEAQTIHRLLGFTPEKPHPLYDAKLPLPCDLLVVDEFSMVDINLAAMLFDALQAGTRVLIVGDADQLPPIGPGDVLRDFLRAGLPQVRLTEVFRQAAESQIVTMAHAVNQGKIFIPDHSKGDLYLLEKVQPETVARTVVRCFLRLLELGYPLEEVQVLTPVRKGPLGSQELNRALQEMLNPPAEGKPEVWRGSTVFRPGDRVMCIENDYVRDVFNGEVGVVTDILVQDGIPLGMVVKFSTLSEPVWYSREELNKLELAYCTTVHKAQGTESLAVIAVVHELHRGMLERNLLYTAVTRAKEKLVVVGTRKAFASAVAKGRSTSGRRNTGLTARLAEKERAATLF